MEQMFGHLLQKIYLYPPSWAVNVEITLFCFYQKPRIPVIIEDPGAAVRLDQLHLGPFLFPSFAHKNPINPYTSYPWVCKDEIQVTAMPRSLSGAKNEPPQTEN